MKPSRWFDSAWFKGVEVTLTVIATVVAVVALVQSCNAGKLAKDANTLAEEANKLTKNYQEFEYAAQLEISGSVDPTHPSLKQPTPGYAYAYRQKHGNWPRWFGFEGRIKNLGTRTIRILRVTLCFEPTETNECVTSTGLLDSFWLKPDESQQVQYDPLRWSMSQDPEEDPFHGMKEVTISLRVRYEGPGGEATSSESASTATAATSRCWK